MVGYPSALLLPVILLLLPLAVAYILPLAVASKAECDLARDDSTTYDEHEYFIRHVRLIHPEAAAPHGVALFRVKFGDDFDAVLADFCQFQGLDTDSSCPSLRDAMRMDFLRAQESFKEKKWGKNEQPQARVSYSYATVHSCNLSAFHDGGKILTLVAGHWNISNENGNKHGGQDKYFNDWFQNTLRINMPYIFFTSLQNIEPLLRHRAGICTTFVSRELDQFKASSFYKSHWIHELHVPSRELGLMWTEKMNLVFQAWQISDSEYFAYIDSALNSLRGKRSREHHEMEFSESVIRSLPINRVSYSYIKDRYGTHSFSGGFILMHRSIVPLVYHLFYEELEMMKSEVDSWECGSDQIIFTRLRDKFPELFHAASYDYGDINYLWANNTTSSSELINKNSRYRI